ncbi:MAG: phosphoribosylanthranilate isomerase [Crocinitomicaceae bacterium]|nr:phosphoribosylanthranilate isomerase [Crocinitomicaceae bacterium]
MLIKVCGMQSAKQVAELDQIVDFIGFIFYEKSKRFVRSTPVVENALKTGVFVNAPVAEVNDCIENESLNVVQLHGNESPEMCANLTEKAKIIKAFGVDEGFNFNKTQAYAECVDYFLFDTRTKLHGGSGRQFDWSLLSNYDGSTPFFLSGGINPDALESIKKLEHPKLIGIDLNSGFEHAPGYKNISELHQFIKELQ